MNKILKIDLLELIYTGVMLVVLLSLWLAMFWHFTFIPWVNNGLKKRTR